MARDWRIDALCVGTEPDSWFPLSGKGPKAMALKAICADCPVSMECLEFATANGIDDGIWGGTTGEERKVAGRGRRKGGPGRVRSLEPCGTSAAYRRHLRHGETPCQLCADAEHQRSTERWEQILIRKAG